MAKPSITKRITKSAALTYSELDTNFQNLADATLTLRAGTGGTNVTADLNGTITLVAGTGITLSGDNSAKTVTVNSSSAQNLFSTIAVAGQSDVVADSTSDILTLVAGSNVTLTTNSTTDTVTIATSVTGITNPLTSDLTLGSYKIIDSNSEAVIQSTQGLMVKSNAYTNAELTIVPGDISNATSRISTKEGVLVINTNQSGSPASDITLSSDGSYISFGLATNGYVVFSEGLTKHEGLTTTQRNALTASNGMIIYNSSTNKFQGRAGGAWVDLH
jgi:hypothetical protein